MSNECNIIFLVLRTVLIFISIALLIYFSRYFWRLRAHFLIASRYPKITIVSVSLINYLLVYDIAIDFIVCNGIYSNESVLAKWILSFSFGLGTFLFSCSVIFRALLVYHKWRMSDFRLKNLSQILTSTVTTSNHFFSHQKSFSLFNRRIRISKKRAYLIIKLLGFTLFIFYVICRYFMETMVIFSIFSYICLTFLMVCGLVIMWYSRKIKEAMMCIRETWIALLTIIVFTIIKALPVFSFAPFINILIIDLNSFVIIGMPLHLLYKVEGTLNVSIIIYSKSSIIPVENKESDNFWYRIFSNSLNSFNPRLRGLPRKRKIESCSGECNSREMKLDVENVDQTIEVRYGTEPEKLSLSPQKSERKERKKRQKMIDLYLYLREYDYYQEFAQFLSECFALEHLLYYVRICVFRRVLLKRLHVKQQSTPINDDQDLPIFVPIMSTVIILSKSSSVISNLNSEDIAGEICYDYDKDNAFCDGDEFLKLMYSVSFDYIQDVYGQCELQTMDETANDIYANFIAVGSMNEINISGNYRLLLTTFFENEEQKSIEDYLLIFNDSILEVYALLNSVYKFQFSSQTRFASEEEEVGKLNI